MIWNITVYIAIWCNQHIVADGDFPNNGTIDPDPHIIADGRRPFPFSTVLLSDCNPFVYVHISAYLHIGIDCNAIRMPKVQAIADLILRPQFHMVFPIEIVKQTLIYQSSDSILRRLRFPVILLESRELAARISFFILQERLIHAYFHLRKTPYTTQQTSSALHANSCWA